MTLLQDGQILRSYSIALGFAPEGDKLRDGNGRPSVGVFRIDRCNERLSILCPLGWTTRGKLTVTGRRLRAKTPALTS